MGWLLRGLAVWAGIVVAEVLHGIARTVLLEPWIGDLHARQLGVVTGSLIIFAIAWIAVGWIDARTPRRLLLVGASWLILTLAFEIGFGRYVMGFSWERLGSDYDPSQGGFLALGMIVLLLAPLLADWVRRRARRQLSRESG